jgi:hypothetical protein
MTEGPFTESMVKDATLSWLESLGWSVKVESRTFAALRDALLPKLISGTLRVPFQSDVAAKGPRHEKDQRT